MCYLPDKLDFQFPDGVQTVLLDQGDDVALYRQLVCWCCLQRYWYYILSNPQVEDAYYDNIENIIKQMEEENDYLNNPHSPTKIIGSSRPESYPKLIRCEFYNLTMKHRKQEEKRRLLAHKIRKMSRRKN